MDRKRASSLIANSGANTMTVGAVNRSEWDPRNKDISSYAYDQERDRFMKDLRRFHDGRGTSIVRLPCVGGRPLDLYSLYNVVTQLGGWEKVTNEDLWPDVQERLKIPKSCSNADYGLRQMYIRFLHHFERVYRFGQDPDSRDDGLETEDGSSVRRKTSGSILGISFTYNYYQHNLSDGMRDMLGASSREMIQANEYSHLERSLLSKLPNEVDFAMNVSLLLSNEGRPAMSGTKGRRIVDCMLSCVGLYKDGFSSRKSLLENGAAIQFLQFWNDTVEDRGIRELACPESLLVDKDSCKSLESGEIEVYWASNRGCCLGSKDTEGQRVTQLAMILRNLSFEEENLDVLSSNLLLIRFLMLCIHNKYGCLRQLAFDTLSNLAHKMVLEPPNCRLKQMVLKTVMQSISSADKLEVISALETLSRICQVDMNEDAVCSQLDDSVYDQIITLLTIHDIPILVAVLEALYQLSELGPITTMRIAESTAAISILLDLLTLEIQSYGPESLAGSKVVEYVHVSALPNMNTNIGSNPACSQNVGPVITPAPGQLMGPPARPPPPSGNSSVRQPLVGQEAPITTPGIHPPGAFAVPRVPGSMALSSHPISVVPSGSIGSPMPASAPPSGMGINGEAMARNWLQNHFEFRADVSSGLTKTDVYKRYVTSCSAYGLQNLLNPVMFASCIRVVFPVAESEPINRDGSAEVFYKGLCPKQSQMMISTMTDRNHMLTAGHPIMLRAPIQSIRQQLVQPIVDQSMTKLPLFSSIHQALIGNIRPSTDFLQQSNISGTNTTVNREVGSNLNRTEAGLVLPVADAATLSASNLSAMPNNTNQILSSSSCLADSIVMKTDEHGTSSSNSLSGSTVQSKTHVASDPSVVEIRVKSNGLSSTKATDTSIVLADNLTLMDNQEIKTNHINGGPYCNGPVTNDVCSDDKNGDIRISSSASSFIKPTADNSSESCAAETPSLLNGHKLGLPNGNCSPVPSCSSDDPDVACDIKRRKALVTNGIEDDEDESSVPMEIDDVLCKAMIRADIIHGVGDPVDVNDDDEDSGMSVDFVTGFMSTNAGEALSNRTVTGYDEEAATAVAGLLKDEDFTSPVSEDQAEIFLSSKVPCSDTQVCSENVLPMSNDIQIQAIPSTTQQVSSTQQAICSMPVTIDRMQQTRFVLTRAPFPFTMAGATPAVPKASSGCMLQQERANGPQAALASGQLHNGVTIMGENAVPCTTEAAQTSTNLPNGLMFSPQCSIALPTGQVVPAGVRLLIRPSGTGTAPYPGGGPPATIVSWNGPVMAATCQPSLGSSGGTVVVGQSGLPSVATGSSLNNACVPSMVPSTSNIQSMPPMFHQRVLLPRPVTIARPDGQVLIQPAPPAAVMPMMATQASLGQLRLAHSAATCTSQPNISVGQPMLLNHQLISLPPRPSSCQNSAAKVVSDGQADNQSVSDQIPYLVRPHQPGQALQAIFSPQHPVRLLGNAVQLHSGLVQGITPGSNPVIIQHGGRQIFLQTQGASAGQPAPGYMMFRPGTAPLIPPRPASNPEPGKDEAMNITISSSAISVGSSSDCGSLSRKRTAPAPVGSRPLRKRKAAGDDSTDGDGSNSSCVASSSKPANLMFVCEWNGCQKCFETFKQIYKHVTKEHFENNLSPTFTCQWAGCDSLPRQRWSFMTHLQDRHLNENLLRLAAEQRWRQQLSNDAQASLSRTSTVPPPPVYPPNAALQAIRRFSARAPFPELMDAPEGPVTKHVRLTAALILRNLARYSSHGRSMLRRHEQLLSYMAFSNVEASVALSHCLHELQKH